MSPWKNRADEIAQRSIYVAKTLRAESAREAAEIVMGGEIDDLEWERFKEPWERNWHLVPDPHSKMERIKRFLRLSPFA